MMAAPNITMMIERTNLVGRWVADSILSANSNKDRVHTLRKYVKIAWRCKELNNFNAIFGIIGGLNTTPICRLQQLWKTFQEDQSKQYSQYKQLEQITDPNKSYKSAREALTNMEPPGVPYVGMFLTDLTFIEDGNHDITPSGLINFAKRRLLAAIIREIQIYQQSVYRLSVSADLVYQLYHIQPRSLEDLYQASLRIQPRQSKRKMLNKRRRRQARDRSTQ